MSDDTITPDAPMVRLGGQPVHTPQERKTSKALKDEFCTILDEAVKALDKIMQKYPDNPNAQSTLSFHKTHIESTIREINS